MYKPQSEAFADTLVDIAAFHDLVPDQQDFRAAVIEGLSRPAKAIPCRFLYDERGSTLFDQICDLPEYYPTRTEIAILKAYAADMAQAIGPEAQLVELGSGSSAKVGILLDALDKPAGYVPIDIAGEHLLAASRRIQAEYPRLHIEAICADFAQAFDLPANRGGGRRVGFYPGSTIGNLEPSEAVGFLAGWARRLGRGALMIVGVDLRKSASIVGPAYDDAQGITARFSLNLLVRANRELGANFDVGCFRHRAVCNADTGRVRIDLVSMADQRVTIDGQSFSIAKDEPLHVENSWKYSIADFQALAQAAGFGTVKVWTDAKALFSVHLLEAG
jgi:dimethylhistidine N-methyltransferase